MASRQRRRDYALGLRMARALTSNYQNTYANFKQGGNQYRAPKANAEILKFMYGDRPGAASPATHAGFRGGMLRLGRRAPKSYYDLRSQFASRAFEPGNYGNSDTLSYPGRFYGPNGGGSRAGANHPKGRNVGSFKTRRGSWVKGKGGRFVGAR
jgi:hypothetical protein